MFPGHIYINYWYQRYSIYKIVGQLKIKDIVKITNCCKYFLMGDNFAIRYKNQLLLRFTLWHLAKDLKGIF